MSLTIESTVFRNPVTLEETYGVRVYDEYGKDYCNLAGGELGGDQCTFEFAKENELDGIEYLIEHEEGATINGTWYEFEDIKEWL